VWTFGRDPAIVLLSEMENHNASMLSVREYVPGRILARRAFAGLLVLIFAAGSTHGAERHNFVVILVDDLRWDEIDADFMR
jgi:hypothetical protein